MSDYQRIKAVRYKLTIDDLAHFGVKDTYELRDKFPEFLESYNSLDKKYFVISDAETPIYLDFILIDEEGYGDYGKTRALTETEASKYWNILLHQFEEMDRTREIEDSWLPDIRNLRLVDFCWYNCSEAPDYFDEDEDPFYEEV